jgi:CheY-specific phosphatase CheX
MTHVDARLAEVTADTLEKLAFLFASPMDTPPSLEERALSTVQVGFAGETTGGLELSLSKPALAELAANMLGVMEGEPLAEEQQVDALKELANVICGNILPVLAGDTAEFTIEAPIAVPPERPAWAAPSACCHLGLDNGVCRVRMRVDGGRWPEPAGKGEAP